MLNLKDQYRRRKSRRRQLRMLAWWRLFSARFDYPQLEPLPAGRRILTLCPHPDDDAIALGGTLLKHHQSGCRLVTVVLTDGSQGIPGAPPEQAAQIRREEQHRAAAHLGVDELLFWNEPDGALTPTKALALKLRRLLEQEQPDLVYLPPFLDVHPDHRAVSALLSQAVQGQAFPFNIGFYESGTPVLANVLVEISDQLETKLLAIREHRSQIANVDYEATSQGLARFHGALWGPGEHYAEAFYIDDLPNFMELIALARAIPKR